MVSAIELVYLSGVIGGMIVGIFTIRQTLISNKRDSDSKYAGMITAEGTSIKELISNKLENINVKFESVDKDTEMVEKDIEKVEIQMRDMVKQFAKMCEKLGSHEYVINDVFPEYKKLYKEFVNFKAAVDVKLDENSSNQFTKKKGTDEGNTMNINRTSGNRDEIRE